jgi:hypothetical protein
MPAYQATRPFAALVTCRAERLTHLVMMASHFFTFNLYLQRRAKQFSAAFADSLISYFASLCKTKGGNEWWSTQRKTFGPEFEEHIDSLIEKTPALAEIQPWWGVERNTSIRSKETTKSELRISDFTAQAC